MATFIATVATGLEDIAAEELAAFGLTATGRAPGAVLFEGPEFPSEEALATLRALNWWGRGLDRVGVLIAHIGIGLLLIAGFLVLAAAGSWQAVAVAGALCGAGHGFAFPILLSMLVTRAPDADRGSAVAAFTAVIDVGTVVAGPLLGAIIDRRGFSTMYVFCAVFLAASVIAYGAWERRIAARSPETSVV